MTTAAAVDFLFVITFASTDQHGRPQVDSRYGVVSLVPGQDTRETALHDTEDYLKRCKGVPADAVVTGFSLDRNQL